MEDLRRQAKELFPSIYLTLVSLVQALALEELLHSAFDQNARFGDGQALAVRLVQMFAVFMGLVVVWHDYVLGVIRYRYVVGLQDSIIPFALGIGEFALIEATRGDRLDLWFLWWAEVLALGVWIYVHQYRRARSDPANVDVELRWGFFTVRQRVACLLGMAAFCAAIGLWLRGATPGPALAGVLVAGVAAGITGYAFTTAAAWRRLVAPART